MIRRRVLDAYRLQEAFVIAVDGTGHVRFSRRHCPHCLTQIHGERAVYYRRVLEARLLTRSGLALSVASEFMDNRHLSTWQATREEVRKQDRELKAFARLAEQLKTQYPQMSRIRLNPATDDRVKTSQCSFSVRTRSAFATQEDVLTGFLQRTRSHHT